MIIQVLLSYSFRFRNQLRFYDAELYFLPYYKFSAYLSQRAHVYAHLHMPMSVNSDNTSATCSVAKYWSRNFRNDSLRFEEKMHTTNSSFQIHHHYIFFSTRLYHLATINWDTLEFIAICYHRTLERTYTIYIQPQCQQYLVKCVPYDAHTHLSLQGCPFRTTSITHANISVHSAHQCRIQPYQRNNNIISLYSIERFFRVYTHRHHVSASFLSHSVGGHHKHHTGTRRSNNVSRDNARKWKQ